jgi:Protein of unknown function (DUF2889)
LSIDRGGPPVTAPIPDLPTAPPTAVHRRSIIMDSYPLGDEQMTVVGRLTDVEPWADSGHEVIHDMTLTVTVRLADLVITSAVAGMGSFPHAECPFIAPAFAQLEGLSVRRGFTKELRQRLGGVSGCAHLGELARAMGPAIVRTSAASHHRQVIADGASADPAGPPDAGPAPLPLGTCHIWAPDGPGVRKIEAGWVPGTVPFPVPPVATFT